MATHMSSISLFPTCGDGQDLGNTSSALGAFGRALGSAPRAIHAALEDRTPYRHCSTSSPRDCKSRSKYQR